MQALQEHALIRERVTLIHAFTVVLFARLAHIADVIAVCVGYILLAIVIAVVWILYSTIANRTWHF